MKRTILQLLCMVGALVLAVAVTPSFAVHKNYGPLSCGSCHTMHNSQGGYTESPDNLGGASGGSMYLLRGYVTKASEVHNLCLQCHATDGSQASSTFGSDSHPAPKVYFAGKDGKGLDSDLSDGLQLNKLGAGGDFSRELQKSSNGWTLTSAGSKFALGYGHSVGLDSSAIGSKYPPGGDASMSSFTCTNCHDPHGTNKKTGLDSKGINGYRNLKGIPDGSGESSPVELYSWTRSYVGMSGESTWTGEGSTQEHYWPIYKTGTSFDGSDSCEDGGQVNCYGVEASGSSTAQKSMTNWCAQCHDNWHEPTKTTSGPWRRHPVDDVISSVDPSNYDPSSIKYRSLPLAKSSDASTKIAYRVPSEDDKSRVFCLSCHFPHGGPYYDSLRWDHLSSVSEGAQDANPIESNVGCQLCHNK